MRGRLVHFLLQRLVPATVRVEGRGAKRAIGGLQLGTGFFVAPGIVVTCRHNVAENGKLLDVTVKVYPADDQPAIECRPREVRTSDKIDAALLLLNEVKNSSVVLDRAISYNQKLLGYGFQTSKDRISSQPFEMIYKAQRKVRTRGITSQCLWLDGNAEREMSGSPLVNLSTMAVCGMIFQKRNTKPEGGVGYALDVMVAEFPELSMIGINHRNWTWQALVWFSKILTWNLSLRAALRIIYVSSLVAAFALWSALILETKTANDRLFQRPGDLGQQALFDVIDFSPDRLLRRSVGGRSLQPPTDLPHFSNLIFPLNRDREIVRIDPRPQRMSAREYGEDKPALEIEEAQVIYGDPNAVQNECRVKARLGRRAELIESPPFASIGVLEPPEICRLFLVPPPSTVSEAVERAKSWSLWRSTTYYRAVNGYYYVQVANGFWRSNNTGLAEPMLSTSIFSGLNISLENCARFGNCVARDLMRLDFVADSSKISPALPRGEPDVNTDLGKGPYLDAGFAVGGALRSLRMLVAMMPKTFPMVKPFENTREIEMLGPFSDIIGPIRNLRREATKPEQLRSMLAANLGKSQFAIAGFAINTWILSVIFALLALLDILVWARTRRTKRAIEPQASVDETEVTLPDGED